MKVNSNRTVGANRPARATKRVEASKSALANRRKRIMANEEAEAEADAVVEQEAIGLLFEAQDVADLVSEITETPVEVTVDKDDQVVFTVGEDVFTVEAEGTEEMVEASRRVSGKRISAAHRISAARRRVQASKEVKRPVKSAAAMAARRAAVKASRDAKVAPARAIKGSVKINRRPQK